MTCRSLRSGTFVAAVLALLATASPATAQQRAPARRATSPSLATIGALAQRATSRSVRLGGRDLGPDTRVPVVVVVDAAREREAIAALVAKGATGVDASFRAADGRTHLTASLPAIAVGDLRGVPGLVGATLDGPLLPAPRPLDVTARLADVTALRNRLSVSGVPLTGAGVTVCSVDSGIDVFHPMFFRADAGTFDFVDRDGNGELDPGIDGVDVGDGVHTIRAMNGQVIARGSGDVLFGTADPAYDPDFDYLYVDTNENGVRDFGPAAGYDDTSPSFGEMLFVADDVSRDGALQTIEKLVGLGTSKVRAFRIEEDVYRRGVNLSSAPWNEDMQHGTGSSSVVLGGQTGFRRLVGMAPEADLIMATSARGQLQMTNFCIAEGAQVVLHEYAPCQGFHLDGSSSLERRIDQTSAMGVSHINPAGNFSTSEKLYKRAVPSGQTTTIPIRLPEIGAHYLYGSLLFHDTSRTPTVRFVGDGTSTVIPDLGVQEELGGGRFVAGGREDSSRGMVRYDFYFWNESAPLAAGDYALEVVDGAPAGGPELQLFAYVTDEISGWGKGAGFPESSSEDHLIGWPGTADHGLAVAAFTGTGYQQGTPGTRAYYSGRGRRLDGAPILWISGPADPIVGTRYDDVELGYLIYGGTSGSSPHVTGVAALIHQAFPGLTGDQVKEKIAAGARTDAETGAVPNEDWGYGKLDAYRSIFGEDPRESVAPSIGPKEVSVLRGPNVIPLAVTDPDSQASDVRVELDRAYDGTFEDVLGAPEIGVDYAELGDQRLRLRATDETGARTDAILLVHVVEQLPPEGEGGAGGGASTTSGGGDVVIAGGGGCTIDSRGASRGASILTGCAIALLACRRRLRRR